MCYKQSIVIIMISVDPVQDRNLFLFNMRLWRMVLAKLDCLDSLSEVTTCTRPMPTKSERWNRTQRPSLPGSCISLKSEIFHITEHH